METPDFVQHYHLKAQKFLENGQVREVVFSGGTYQIEVVDEAIYWPFLQIDDLGNIKDGFCTCSTSEKEGSCAHLAAAYLRVVIPGEDPLHMRFQHSFWNALCKTAAQKFGYETSVLKRNKDKYSNKEISLFTTNQAALKKLHSFLKDRVEETEETSIKFSNLTIEELEAYRKGEVQEDLQYELSFWSDLAKWMFLMQDAQKKYSLTFSTSGQELPTSVLCKINGLEANFSLTKEDWIVLIPSLKTVHSDLNVFEFQGQVIEKITYNEEKVCFEIQKHKDTEPQVSGGIELDGWIYVAGEGFYPRKPDPLLQSSVIEEPQIPIILDQYTDTLTDLLQNTEMHSDPVDVQYNLFFDEYANLHIESYLFEKKDLQQPCAAFFKKWAYLPNKGFYPLKNVQFDRSVKIITKHEVSEFINQSRMWLHQFEGFQAHFQSLQSHLTYAVNEEGDLRFDSELNDVKNYENFLDFGEWVYIKSMGFYVKYETSGGLPLSPGQVINKEDVSLFVGSHKDQLELVQGFFTQIPPIKEMGLEIRLIDENTIEVEPRVEFSEGYSLENVRFYSHYAFVKNEGFYELPESCRIEKEYQRKVTFKANQFSSFFEFELEKLEPKSVYIDPRLKKPNKLKLQVRRVVREKRRKRKTWLVDLWYKSEFGSVNVYDFFDLLKKKFFFSEAGRLRLASPRFRWIHQLTVKQMDAEKKMIRLNTLEWIRLCIYEDVETPTGNSPEAIESRKALKELESLETTELLDAKTLKATLRPYQEVGLQWLWFLYSHELSGLLCDEMGLGKTLQAMGLMASAMAQDPQKKFKFLVVCPTSVIFHWQEQLARFLPSMRVLVYHGQTRSLVDFEENYDLLLTSYGILRTGREDFRSLEFQLATFDEAQIAKNHLSQTHKSLKKIKSRVRLGLTGTPIENNLVELKALLDLVLPNYLPGEKEFRDQFSIPIEKSGDIEQRKLLSKLIQPFILRRKKSEVLKDLPEKIEEVRKCELSSDQKRLYKELASASQNELLRELGDDSKPVPYLHVFSLLSKFKQICDHPILLEKDPKSYEKYESGKWDLFVELLSEARESGQKVVVFSQYLDMLQIIELYLKKHHIGYACIKGSTKNRREPLLRFREDPKCEVFVASLLAAGVGIDLSSASVVIHYDRWWNPAKENQATDRVHRIGQNRGVQVFKLVTMSTVEEDIHYLIEKKKGLIEETLGSDDIDQIKLLTREELIEIVRQTAEIS